MIGIRDPVLDYGSVPFSFLYIRRRTTSLCAPNAYSFAVLIEFDRGHGLIFTRAPRNLILQSISCVDEDLPHAIERRSPVAPLTMKKVTIRP